MWWAETWGEEMQDAVEQCSPPHNTTLIFVLPEPKKLSDILKEVVNESNVQNKKFGIIKIKMTTAHFFLIKF